LPAETGSCIKIIAMPGFCEVVTVNELNQSMKAALSEMLFITVASFSDKYQIASIMLMLKDNRYIYQINLRFTFS